MALQDDLNALIAAAEAVDTASATLAPLLADLTTAEESVRRSLVAEGVGLRDHRAGAAQLSGLAVSLLTGKSELDGTPLASIVSKAYGDLIPQGGAA